MLKRTLIIIMMLACITRAFAQQDASSFAARNSEANQLIRDGRYDQAEQLLNQLSGIQQNLSPEQQAELFSTLGSLHLNKGRNDLALENLQKAMSLWEKENKSQTLEAANTQSLLGNLYRATGKYVQAEEQLSIALAIREKLLQENDERIAASLNDLGLVYTMSDIDKALTYYERGLAIYEKVHGADDPKIAIAKTNIGYLYTKLELFGDAINNFESALAIWNKIYRDAHPSKAFVLFNLGQTYQKMTETARAREYFVKASEVYKEAYSGKHPDMARVYNALGNLEAAENKFEEALAYYQMALQVNHPQFTSSNIYDNPGIKQHYDGNVLLYSMMYKAQALESSYFRKTLRFKELLLAIKTLESSDSLIDRLRQQITNESDKITLGAIANEVYADGVRISMEAANAAFKKEPFYRKAFVFAEKSKAAVLLGAISDANAKSFAGIPVALLESENQLKSSIAMASQKLAQKPDAEVERKLRQQLYELNREYENFSRKLEKDFPAYYNLKYNASAPSIEALQARLQQGTLLLSYFNDDKNATLYIFSITKDTYNVREAKLPPQFDRFITGLRNSMYFSDLSTFNLSAGNLSKVLLPKIGSQITDLVIIPTGRLSTLPFEVLFTAAPEKENSFQTLPYLVRKYAVRYEFSGGLIIQKQEKANKINPSILLCAPVNFNPSQAVSDLPGTESEVKDISGLFQQKQYGTKLLVGDNAEEKFLKNETLNQYAYLHFATHGVVDETNPELSRIFLKTGTGSEDGYLYSGEIYNLQLDADLVTLSACETGLGKISKGEGVIGLSRALVYSGARNCMVTFWKVADESTSLLMKNYYEQLLNSSQRNLSATLRAAKQTMINDGKYSAPYYWAPFILIGF